MEIYKKQTLSDTFKVYFDYRMIKILLLGAISGFPWVIIGSSLSLWLKEDGLSRSTIGWAGLIFAVYAFNYLWAPIIDRVRIPWLTNKIKKNKNILKPLVVKLSPDLESGDISKIIEIIIKYNIEGIIISNTTDRNRDNLFDVQKNEKGGLSGRPLKDLSTNLIKKFYRETKGKIQIIGVGGVDSGEAAFEKITAGANAIQLYTGMVYKGPGIVKDMKKELISILKKENLRNISEAVGINA